jgi:integrase
LPPARTKNKREHDVPMSDPVRKLLKRRKGRGERDLVFGTGKGPFSGWSRAKEALDANVPLPAWRLHDLRRTVATQMAENGVQPHIIEAVLNHVSGHKAGVAGIYNRATYAAEKREALELWAGHLQKIVAP